MTTTGAPACPFCSEPRYINKHGQLTKTCGRRTCRGKSAAASMPPGHFRRVQRLGHAKRRENIRKTALRPHEECLMAAGRFLEAAQSIRQRAYNAGWSAGRRGFKQRPAAVAVNR